MTIESRYPMALRAGWLVLGLPLGCAQPTTAHAPAVMTMPRPVVSTPANEAQAPPSASSASEALDSVDAPAPELEECLCGRRKAYECKAHYAAWRATCARTPDAANCELLRRPVLDLTPRSDQEMGPLLCATAALSAVSDEDLLPLRTSFGAMTLFVHPNTAKTRAKAREMEGRLRSFDYAECGSRLAIGFAASSCGSGEELVAALTKVARPLTHRCSEYINSGERAIALCARQRSASH